MQKLNESVGSLVLQLFNTENTGNRKAGGRSEGGGGGERKVEAIAPFVTRSTDKTRSVSKGKMAAGSVCALLYHSSHTPKHNPAAKKIIVAEKSDLGQVWREVCVLNVKTAIPPFVSGFSAILNIC